MPMNSKIENTLECLEKKLAETQKKLAELRNFRADAGSKILVEDAWQRYLVYQISTLRALQSVNPANLVNPTTQTSVQKCTQEMRNEYDY